MEFELEPRTSYYLSYTDKIITGSMIHFDSEGNRGRGMVGSIVSGSNEYKGDYSYSLYLRRKQAANQKPTFVRGVQLVNSSKLFHDTLMPDFSQVYRLNGGQFVTPVWEEIKWNFDFGNTSSIVYSSPIVKLVLTKGNITGSTGAAIGDAVWQYEYPFMGKYSGVPKVLNVSKILNRANQAETIEDIFSNRLLFIANPVADVSSSNKYTICFATGSNISLSLQNYYDRDYRPTVYNVEEQAIPLTRKNLVGLSSRDLLTCFFGFGVTPNLSPDSTTITYNQGLSTKAYGPTIQGWKYGVLSGIPTSPKAVFRIGKFGQFRDMLEPRLYSKTLDPNTNTTDSPMLVNFLSGTQAYLTASSPLTLNLSDAGYYDLEYKCGRPYIEGAAY